MKIKLTRNTVVAGESREVGDVVDVNDRLAKYLVSIGKATGFIEDGTPTDEEENGTGPLETTNADAIVETPETPKKATAKKSK